jgi:hypothetical protein
MFGGGAQIQSFQQQLGQARKASLAPQAAPHGAGYRVGSPAATWGALA